MFVQSNVSCVNGLEKKKEKMCKLTGFSRGRSEESKKKLFACCRIEKNYLTICEKRCKIKIRLRCFARATIILLFVNFRKNIKRAYQANRREYLYRTKCRVYHRIILCPKTAKQKRRQRGITFLMTL